MIQPARPRPNRRHRRAHRHHRARAAHQRRRSDHQPPQRPTLGVFDAIDITKPAADRVRNGNPWRVFAVDTEHNRVAARRLDDGARAAFSGDYLHQHITHGYAVTVHSAQGVTADATHAVLSETTSRALLYVALTRGRESNQAYLYERLAGEGDHEHAQPDGLHIARRGSAATTPPNSCAASSPPTTNKPAPPTTSPPTHKTMTKYPSGFAGYWTAAPTRGQTFDLPQWCDQAAKLLAERLAAALDRTAHQPQPRPGRGSGRWAEVVDDAARSTA